MPDSTSFIPDRSPGHLNATNQDKAAHIKKPYSIAIKCAPVTTERLPYVPASNDRLLDPGVARANSAPTQEHPHGTQGTWHEQHKNQTVLQQHCAYFDPDNDGIIWPLDTYRSTRAWGWSILLAAIAASIIHFGLSYPSNPSWIPDPFFRIWISRVHKNAHGSDSLSYDNEGRFRPQLFEDTFSKYDVEGKGGLSIGDLLRFHKGQRNAFDFWGWSATFLEWTAVYLLLWPEDGIVRKEDARKVMDGSIFQIKADEYTARKQNKGITGAQSGGMVKSK
ncbi:caleosin domain-containing protein [Zymoseptoria brevis]|uniref:Caleosin domain-containing protein n=1 Tax=Zymoseptoria brevis TaxID=1047168 RepID=A0A0F4GAC4_9PEZI|nr:caleosin domain-containing protein [Zymoseptoria brevis]